MVSNNPPTKPPDQGCDVPYQPSSNLNLVLKQQRSHHNTCQDPGPSLVYFPNPSIESYALLYTDSPVLHGRAFLSPLCTIYGDDIPLMHRPLPRAHPPLASRNHAGPVPRLVAREIRLLLHPRRRPGCQRRGHHPAREYIGLASTRWTLHDPHAQIDVRVSLLGGETRQGYLTSPLPLRGRLGHASHPRGGRVRLDRSTTLGVAVARQSVVSLHPVARVSTVKSLDAGGSPTSCAPRPACDTETPPFYPARWS